MDKDLAFIHENLHEHPFFSYHIRNVSSIEGNAIKLTDIVTNNQFRRLGIYNEVFKNRSVKYQMTTPLVCDRRNIIGICFHRDKKDFSEDERLILNLFGPYIVEAHRNIEAFEKIQQALSVIEENTNCGIIVIGKNHRIKFQSAAVERLLNEHFSPGSHSKYRFPDELKRWMRQQQSLLSQKTDISPPLNPFIKENEKSRIVIRLIRYAEEFLLLLKQESQAASYRTLKSLGLSSRETEVLYWITKGKTNSDTAAILNISAGTVKIHLENIYRKLGVENRTAAAMFAMEMLGITGNG